VGSILNCFPREYAQSLRAEKTEGMASFDFFYVSHVHLLGEFGLFLAIRVQNMSHAGCSHPNVLNF